MAGDPSGHKGTGDLSIIPPTKSTLNEVHDMTMITSSSLSRIAEPITPTLISPAMLGWRKPRQVAYINRHPQLNDQCLYFWNHQENTPVPTDSQDLIMLMEDIYVEQRGQFKAHKLIVDADLGLDGRLRLIVGFSTSCATTLMASLAALSTELLLGPLSLRLRAGSSQGVVLPAIYVDNDWIDGRPLSRDERGNPLPAIDLLTEVQTLLRHAMAVDLLPHQVRQQQRRMV
jgi:hypothetical protein